MHPIAHVRSGFREKFGIPRQSGLVPDLTARVVFEPEYRSWDAVRGLEGFSHVWLIWVFSGNIREGWSPTVRPPRLGGNQRLGVFATRSPFRPNPIGLSAVELREIADGDGGPELVIGGADLLDGTPVLDVKPYVPSDAILGARGGFLTANPREPLLVEIPEELEERVPPEHRSALRGLLAEDPRPAYQHEPGRVYGLAYAGLEVRFRVEDRRLVVVGISR